MPRGFCCPVASATAARAPPSAIVSLMTLPAPGLDPKLVQYTVGPRTTMAIGTSCATARLVRLPPPTGQLHTLPVPGDQDAHDLHERVHHAPDGKRRQVEVWRLAKGVEKPSMARLRDVAAEILG